MRGDIRWIHALQDQKITDGIRSVFGEAQARKLVATGNIGVAFHLDSQTGMAQNNSGDSRQLFASDRAQDEAAAVEMHVRHVDDQAARRVDGLQNRGELIVESLAKLLPVFF